MNFWTSWPQHLLADVSLWSADLSTLGAEIKRVEPYADMFHLDVADAHFVPGLLFFPDLVAALRPWTDVPFHMHLMTEHPTTHISAFAEAGANLITVHHENGAEASTALEQVHRRGLAAGLALQLETPPEAIVPYLADVQLILLMGTQLGVKGLSLDPSTYTREQTVRQIIRDHGYEGRVKIGVDGGIREQTVPLLRQAGADLVVPGSLVFKSAHLAQTFQWLHALSAPLSGPVVGGELLMLIAMAGLPGTGKSTLAQRLADALGAIILDKDIVRAALFPPALVEYSTEQDDFCMSVMFQVSAYLLRKHSHLSVIIDGRTFSRHYQVMALKQLAEQLQTPLKIIECVCSDETARQRLEAAASGKKKHLAQNRDYALYLEIKARFEPINEPKLLVNTDEDLARCLDNCLSYVKQDA